MNYILFDGPARNALLPFTFTRPLADIRIGILTIREKWETYLGFTTTTLTEDYLSEKYCLSPAGESIWVEVYYFGIPKTTIRTVGAPSAAVALNFCAVNTIRSDFPDP